MPTKWTKEWFIAAAQHVHGTYKFDYGDVLYVNSTTDVTVKCNDCTVKFRVSPANHIHRKSGCPQKECKRKRTLLTNMLIRGVANPMHDETVKQKLVETNMRKYKVKNPMQHPDVQAKVVATNQRIWGAACVLQNVDVKTRIASTNKAKFDSENPFGSSLVQAQIVKTHINKRGVENPMQDPGVLAKARATNIIRYSVPCSLQNPEVQAKAVATNVSKYGAPNAMQNAEIANKSLQHAFQRKSYVLPDGQLVYLMGFEPFCMDELLLFYPQANICLDYAEMPEVTYMTSDGKWHKYFPDMFILSERRFVEVKSTWTLSNSKEREKNWLKWKACRDAKIPLDVIVYDTHGNKLGTLQIREHTDRDTFDAFLHDVGCPNIA